MSSECFSEFCYITLEVILTKKYIVIFRCINRNGGFQCICDDGFSGEDGTTCKDIDECTENPTLCENGICLNDQVYKEPFTN